MFDNEWEDAECPECGCGINEFGFCYDCGLDFEEAMAEQHDRWDAELWRKRG